MLPRAERHAGLDHEHLAPGRVRHVPRRRDQEATTDGDRHVVRAEHAFPIDGRNGQDLDGAGRPGRIEARELVQVCAKLDHERVRRRGGDVRFEARPRDVAVGVLGEHARCAALDEEIRHRIRNGGRDLDAERRPRGIGLHGRELRGCRHAGQPTDVSGGAAVGSASAMRACARDPR